MEEPAPEPTTGGVAPSDSRNEKFIGDADRRGRGGGLGQEPGVLEAMRGFLLLGPASRPSASEPGRR